MRSRPITVDIQVSTGTSYDADGFLQTGVDGESAETNIPQVECFGVLGLISRPLDPGTDPSGAVDTSQACQVLRLSEDNADHAIPLADPRSSKVAPQVGKGSVMLHEPSAATDPGRVVLNADQAGEVLVHAAASAKVRVEIASGPTVVVDGGAASITLSIPGGPSIVLDATNFAQIGGPGGNFIVVDNGALSAAFGALAAALAAAPGGPINWTPPSNFTALKAKAT